MKNRSIISIALFLLLFSQVIFAQTTEFTYQGRLLDGTLAANGNYDFEFSQFDAQTGGTQIGSTITINSVTVTNGVFTVRLDFGQVFGNGTDRFLEINVRQTGGGAFTPLTPRQPITSTPYAQKSLNAETATLSQNSNELGGLKPADFTLTTDPRLSDDRNPLPGSTHYIQNTVTPPFSGFDITTEGEANSFNARLYYRLNNEFVLSNKGINNIFLGVGAGDRIITHPNNTVGQGNTFVGNSAGLINLTPNFNSFFGYSSGRNNTVGTRNSFFGYQSGFFNNASDNSFFGYRAGITNSTGINNTFLGSQAGEANDEASNNTFIGTQAGELNQYGLDNTFVGSRAGQKNFGNSNSALLYGNYNSFFGSGSGQENSTGQANTFLGYLAGRDNVSGDENTIIGANAGLNNTANRNTFIGNQAGMTNVSGSGNILIGNGADVSSGSGISGAIVIGNGITATADNMIRIGNSIQVDSSGVNVGTLNATTVVTPTVNATDVNSTRVTTTSNVIVGNNLTVNGNSAVIGSLSSGFINTGPAGSESICRLSGETIIRRCASSIRYKENVQDFRSGLDLVKKLRPVTFNWKSNGEFDVGLVAEEVNEIEPVLTTFNEDGRVEGVKYNRIGVVAVNAIVEQQEQIESQQKQIDEQKEIINQQSEKLIKQEEELQALKAFVCSENPTAKFCAEKEENNEEN